ncbi:MAG: tRNA lysidine(34) synthetase TilS [Candidatus Bipolaricaulota bacterium]
MRAMLDKVREAIRRYGLLERGERVLVAVSGGADSMALLHALHRLRDELALSLAVAHLDHGIRADTGEDLGVVRRAAGELGLPLFHERVDVPSRARAEGGNLEQVARVVRREFLERAMGRAAATRIALGHTRTDAAETVLLHLLRGAGPRGLRGILPCSPPYVRPLILASRHEARAFCQAEGIPFRDDPTNADRRLARNAIRLDVLPLLARFNPQAEEALARAAGLLSEAEEALTWIADHVLAEVSRERGLDLGLLCALPRSVQALVVRRAAERAGGVLEERHVAAVLAGVSVGKGEVRLPGGISARIGSGILSFGPAAGSALPDRAWELPPAGEVRIGDLGWAFHLSPGPRPEVLDPPDPFVAYFDFRRIAPPLVVRTPRPGDRLRPLGMDGTRRVGDVLMEAGVPRWERGRWPLVCDQRGIAWVVGVRASEDHRVMPDASEVLVVEARRL